MSKQQNNNATNHLKSLFEKRDNGQDLPKDDFATDAIEGFALLQNEEEAYLLKDELDKKINKEVFIKEKKTNPIVYWFAAAGLFLVVSLSVLFIKDFNKTKQIDLAVVNERMEQTETIKSKENQVVEDLQEMKLKSENLKDINQKENPTNKKHSNHKAVATVNSEKNAKPNLSTFSGDPVNSVAEGASFAYNDEKEVAAVRKDVAPRVSEQKNEPNEAESVVALAKEKALKQSASKKMIPSASNADSFEENSLSTICFYTNGEVALNKDLKEKLEKQKLSQKFDAILFINENKIIENVVFTNAFDLTAKQQKQIISVLKTLDKFNFYSTPKENSLVEYKLSFKP